MNMDRLLRIAPFLAAVLLAIPAFASTAFFPVRLAESVVVELPADWTVVEGGPRGKPEASVQERAARGGEIDAVSALRFAADAYDPDGRVAARVAVRYHPWQKISQRDVADATDYELRQLDRGAREAVEQSAGKLGVSVVEWNGTTRRDVAGAAAFLTEYKRSQYDGNGSFVVRMLRVFDGPRSFTLTVSYREADARRLRPVCDRILASLRRAAP
jgi:hypothetical protein